MNRLRAERDTSVGVFLEDERGNDVLLPNKYVPETLREGDFIDVFVYTDSEDRPVATLREPYIQRDEFGFLEVVSVTSVGAFLDWGLEKDLFVPHKEQSIPMQVGRRYVVYCYLDRDTDRLVASSRINRFLDDRADDLEEGQEVDLLAYEHTDLGLNVIVNNQYRGLLYKNELFRPVSPGDRLTGYVKRIREDNRIDVSLQRQGYENIEPNAQRILDTLQANNGFLPLNDDSAPEAIYKTFEMSKKTFKKAIGTLYRERRVIIKDEGIFLA
ncbi:S1-like domain-containing RNA-binding protein [Nibrella viscosa]|uniref:S1-like domain-containing RNA-binding protein n=2 Tax=Nibrella viscosa TaxID=1084524 RepID=A0ABP8L3I7_9BACT